jgi:hypothetical protein
LSGAVPKNLPIAAPELEELELLEELLPEDEELLLEDEELLLEDEELLLEDEELLLEDEEPLSSSSSSSREEEKQPAKASSTIDNAKNLSKRRKPVFMGYTP